MNVNMPVIRTSGNL